MMRRILVVGYGLAAYVAFLVVFVTTVGFLANTIVPRGIDDGTVSPRWIAVLVNTGLLFAFALQHTVMARPAFKRWLARFIPASIERSTFVLVTSLLLAAVILLWQPIPDIVWTVDAAWLRLLLWAANLLGWLTVVGSTFMISHFDLVGLSQVLADARAREHREPSFQQTMLYRFVRHPIMVGFLIAFWATPDMSQGRLLFAALGSAYILVGVRFEEHDLRTNLGEEYLRYQQQVPRFVPRLQAGDP